MPKYPPLEQRSTQPKNEAGKGDVRRLPSEYSNTDKYDQWQRSGDINKVHTNNGPDSEGICLCTKCGVNITPFNTEYEKECNG